MAQHDHVNETMTEPDDALAMLKADHHPVRTLFQLYEDTPDLYLKQIIAEHVFAELALHALLEEGAYLAVIGFQHGNGIVRLVHWLVLVGMIRLCHERVALHVCM